MMDVLTLDVFKDVSGVGEENSYARVRVCGIEMPEAQLIDVAPLFHSVCGLGDAPAGLDRCISVTIRVPGHTYWAGRFIHRGYAPVELQTWLIWEIKKDVRRYLLRGIRVSSVPVRAEKTEETFAQRSATLERMTALLAERTKKRGKR